MYALVNVCLPMAHRYRLNLYAAPTAIDTTHRIQQNDGKTSDRDELEATFPERIVAACALVAARTNWFGSLTWAHVNLNGLRPFAQSRSFINEAREMMTGIEQAGQKHG
jgi:hypothetical protein